MKKLIDAMFEVDFNGDLALFEDPDVWICEAYFLRLLNRDSYMEEGTKYNVVVTDTPTPRSIPLMFDGDFDVSKLGYSNCFMDSERFVKIGCAPYITLIVNTARFFEERGLVPDVEYFFTITEVEDEEAD